MPWCTTEKEKIEHRKWQLLSENDPNWPVGVSKAQRYVALNDFITLHRLSFMMFVDEFRRLLRHPCDLDPCSRVFVFTLGHRPNSDGNPATRLFLKKFEILKKTYPAIRSDDEPEESLGDLDLVYITGGVEVYTSMPIHRDLEVFKGENHMPDWMTHLRMVTTKGIVFARDPADEWGVGERPGIMQKQGKVWKWAKTSPRYVAELAKRPWRYLGPEPEIDVGDMAKFLRKSL